MSSLTALLRNTADKSPPDDDKLMDLYWNRNELKKEFANLRNEKFRLADKIKQQDGAIARLQQKLDHVEGLLIDPEWARSALVFYQLRGVGLRCQRKLARFAEQLKQQREQKQQSHVMARWQNTVAQDIQSLESQLRSGRESILQLEEQLQAQNRQLSAMSGIVRIFRRRAISADIDKLTLRLQSVEQESDALRRRIDEVKSQPPPDAAGLDIGTKRSINFMIVAFAQQLHILFDDDDLMSMVKEAGEKSAGAIRYGSDRDCEEILARIRHSMDALDGGGDFAGILKQRAKLIGGQAAFRSDDDAVPVADTVATLYKINSNGVIRERDLNLLGDNYWSIASVLSR